MDLEKLNNRELIALFTTLPTASSTESFRGEYDAKMLNCGVMGPLGYLYSNFLFGPGKWVGKGLALESNDRGINYFQGKLFGNRFEGMPMALSITPSTLDSKDSLEISYEGVSKGPSVLMRDEIRRVDDDTLLGLSFVPKVKSMTGINSAFPFLLKRKSF